MDKRYGYGLSHKSAVRSPKNTAIVSGNVPVTPPHRTAEYNYILPHNGIKPFPEERVWDRAGLVNAAAGGDNG